jgi:hypothetical protein
VVAGPAALQRRAALAALVGAALPLLPFLVHEGVLLAAGEPSALLGSLGQRKGNLVHPERIPTSLGAGLLWMFSLPFGNEPLHAALRQNRPPSPGLFLAGAVAGAVVFAWAGLQVVRRRSDPALTGLLLAQLVALVLSGLLYATGLDFQVFLPFTVLSCALVARFLLALADRAKARVTRPALVPLVLLPFVGLYLLQLFVPLSRSASLAPTGRETQEAVVRVPEKGSTVVTTAYNQVGLFTFLRKGEVHEVNVDRLLSVGETREAYAANARDVFRRFIERHPDGSFLFDAVPIVFDEGREPIPHTGGKNSRELVLDAFYQTAREMNYEVREAAAGTDDRGQTMLLLLRLTAGR